jgi:hypothetical protein
MIAQKRIKKEAKRNINIPLFTNAILWVYPQIITKILWKEIE